VASSSLLSGLRLPMPLFLVMRKVIGIAKLYHFPDPGKRRTNDVNGPHHKQTLSSLQADVSRRVVTLQTEARRLQERPDIGADDRTRILTDRCGLGSGFCGIWNRLQPPRALAITPSSAGAMLQRVRLLQGGFYFGLPQPCRGLGFKPCC